MFTLAIETATIPGSVAIADESHLVASHAFERQQRTVQWLAPTIRRLAEESQVSLAKISGIAVLAGPGSFTGLRIGITTAKMLGYALGCRLATLNTLDVIASQATDTCSERLDVVMGAQQNQLFVRSYVRADSVKALSPDNEQIANAVWEPATEVEIRDEAVWLAGLNDQVAVSGPWLDRVKPELLKKAEVVPSQRRTPNGWSLARAAQIHWDRNGSDDIWKLTPNYFRKSYAE